MKAALACVSAQLLHSVIGHLLVKARGRHPGSLENGVDQKQQDDGEEGDGDEFPTHRGLLSGLRSRRGGG